MAGGAEGAEVGVEFGVPSSARSCCFVVNEGSCYGCFAMGTRSGRDNTVHRADLGAWSTQ